MGIVRGLTLLLIALVTIGLTVSAVRAAAEGTPIWGAGVFHASLIALVAIELVLAWRDPAGAATGVVDPDD